MKEIQLTRGYSALVDDEDYDRINAKNWVAQVATHVKNYVRAGRSVQKNYVRTMIYMQYEVLQTTPQQGKQIDHIDRNPLNNQKSNLRIVTRQENMQNTVRCINHRGVCYNKRANLWMAYVDTPTGPRKYLGYTKTKEGAELIVRNEKECAQ